MRVTATIRNALRICGADEQLVARELVADAEKPAHFRPHLGVDVVKRRLESWQAVGEREGEWVGEGEWVSGIG